MLARPLPVPAVSPRDLALILLVCVAWARNFLISAHALREIPPFLFTAVRFALLAVPLVVLLRAPAPGNGRGCSPRACASACCISD